MVLRPLDVFAQRICTHAVVAAGGVADAGVCIGPAQMVGVDAVAKQNVITIAAIHIVVGNRVGAGGGAAALQGCIELVGVVDNRHFAGGTAVGHTPGIAAIGECYRGGTAAEAAVAIDGVVEIAQHVFLNAGFKTDGMHIRHPGHFLVAV